MENWKRATDEELVAEHKNALYGEKNADTDGLVQQAKSFRKTKKAIVAEVKRRATSDERRAHSKLRRFFT